MEESQLKARVWEDFEKSGIAGEAACLDQVVLKVPRAYPIYRVGYREELKRVLDYLSSVGNLLSTGRNGLFHYNNSDHSMEVGRLAAEYARQSPTRSKGWYDKRDEFDRYRIVD
jgi:protoporphyrinogen oxidase